MVDLNIAAAGAAGVHIVRKVNVNAQFDYLYFKDENLPALGNGTSYIYSDGSGTIDGIVDDTLVYARVDLPTVISLVDDEDAPIGITGSAAGAVTFNLPVVWDNILNIATTTPTNQAVKYLTSGDSLTGLVSGDTYFLRNVPADFAGSQGLYQLASVEEDVIGQAQFTTPGTTSWTPPAGVYEVSVVAVGGGGGGAQSSVGGGGGGGGGLGWRRSIPVSPGRSYTVVVGAAGSRDTSTATANVATNGGDSFFISPKFLLGQGGRAASSTTNPGVGGIFVGDGGGNGGSGGSGSSADAGGGGGAGGYAGNGGQGGNSNNAGSAGSGGAAGGGGAGGDADRAGGGGGVGILGQGANGAGGIYNAGDGSQGGGGSGGAGLGASVSAGGAFGGGGGGADNTGNENGSGGNGAVRIIWGSGRFYPSTRTANE